MDVTAAATLFAWLDREGWLVTSQDGPRQGGLIATFVSPASIVPESPRVLVALAHTHRTAELVEASGCFAMHLLSEENLELVWRFGLQSSRDVDKFAGLEVGKAPSGCPVLGDTVGWLDCRVEARHDIGDRAVFVADVVQGEVTHFAPPLTMRRLLELAPAHRLSEMQRRRHHDGFRDAQAIRLWRGLSPEPPPD
jgi:flavin reductase (DIM6/NTAB) family NADH-FMN oxidoreductase RutF